MDSLPFRRAFLEGYLLPHEYAACYGFAGYNALIVVMGLLLSREEPGWVGHLLWTGMMVVGFTFVPAVKWFGTYEVGIQVLPRNDARRKPLVVCLLEWFEDAAKQPAGPGGVYAKCQRSRHLSCSSSLPPAVDSTYRRLRIPPTKHDDGFKRSLRPACSLMRAISG